MFLDCSSVIVPNPPGLFSGVAVADLDGDGEPEVFVCGLAGPNRVLKWTGSALRDIAPPELAGGPALAAAFADLDGDGREELYILGTNARGDRLFTPADGRWVNRIDRPDDRGERTPTEVRAVAAIDRRGTGRYGFVVTGCGRPLRLIEPSPAGPLIDLAPALGIDLAAAACGLLVAPLVGDRPDVFCPVGGSNLLFRNTGLGTFLEVAAEHGLADAGEAGLAATAVDADGDGRLDVCCANWEGPHRLMVRRPDGAFRDRATPAMALPSVVRAVVAADFDNDGYEELFFINLGEANRLFRSGPTGWSLADAGAAAEPDGRGTGVAVADLDGDGRLELLIAHADPAARPLTLYKGPRTGNAWLRVRPLTRFGASARGAAVRLAAAGRTQVRVIDGGGGLGQAEPVAHFGLGRDPVVDAVTVTWPDGATMTLDGPVPLRTITVPYPGG